MAIVLFLEASSGAGVHSDLLLKVEAEPVVVAWITLPSSVLVDQTLVLVQNNGRAGAKK